MIFFNHPTKCLSKNNLYNFAILISDITMSRNFKCTSYFYLLTKILILGKHNRFRAVYETRSYSRILLTNSYSCALNIRLSHYFHEARHSVLKLCNPQAISITRSSYFSFVLRNISLTIRHLFTPEMTCSTMIRVPEIIEF